MKVMMETNRSLMVRLVTLNHATHVDAASGPLNTDVVIKN